MTSTESNDNSEQTEVGSTPDALLAQKVLNALVADGLVSEADAANIRADLAGGALDPGKWKMVLENQLERKALADERK